MKPSSVVFRIVVVVVIAISVVTLPWWIPCIAVLLFSFYFKWFIEGVVIGACIDLLYSSAGQTILGSHHVFLVGGIAIVGLSVVLRSVLKFY